ncbi:MAG TPA: hypothetical protein VGS04_06195 [Nitrososphaerales archaeon]|nr:hypothetical protein [Nitrososphaerales archaeon]
MRQQQVLGLVLLVAGFLLLYFLRGVFVELILLVLGFLGVILAIILIVVGLAMVFATRRPW